MKGPIDGQQKSGLSDDGEVVTLDQETGEPHEVARWRAHHNVAPAVREDLRTESSRAAGSQWYMVFDELYVAMQADITI